MGKMPLNIQISYNEHICEKGTRWLGKFVFFILNLLICLCKTQNLLNKVFKP